MKIVFCTPGNVDFADYKKGNLLGTESQVLGLAKEFAIRGNEVYIIRRWYKGSLKEENIKGIHIINIIIPNFYISKHITKILFSKYVRDEIKKINPDYLILTEIMASYFICTLKIPKIYVTHNTPGDLYLDRGLVDQFIKKYIERKIFQNCDLIISLNCIINEYFCKNGYKSMFIPNAVEIKKYNYNNSDGSYILFGGRFNKIKGLKYLIEAYALLSDEIQNDYKLLLVGDGPDKKNIEMTIEELGISNIISFIPWLLSDKYLEIISNCSIFVLPSLSECMPVALLEAMALGKAVIASDIPGPNDIITHGYNGFLFNKGDVIELKKYMDILARDKQLRCEMGRNAKKTIEDKYTAEKIAVEYEKVFQMIRR